MRKSLLTVVLTVLALLAGQNVQAQIHETSYTVTGGSQLTGNESVYKLLDGDVNTKWCEMCNPYADPLYVEFKSYAPFVPTGYIMTTANDNVLFNYRYPTIWRLKAKYSPTDEWTELSYVSNQDALGDKNCAPYEFGVNNESHAKYQCFRLEIYNIRSYYIDYFQLSEFQLKGYSYLEDMRDAIVTFSKPVFDYNNGNPEAISYTITDGLGNPINNCTATTDPATVSAEGQYKMTIAGPYGYNNEKIVYFWVKNQLSGAGTEASPYMINSDADWDLFAERVRLGDTYQGKFVKLGNDVNVTTMAGSSEVCSFQGTFDGAGKTMHVNLTATEDACAPFRYLKEAQVKNLNVDGSVISAYHYAGGLVAYGYGTCLFTNCGSTVTITSTRTDSQKDFHGGLIAVYYPKWSVTFNNCIFAGKMLGGNSYAVSGFVGYSFATVYYEHCLYAGTEFTMNDKDSYSFNGNSNYSHFRGDSYVTTGIDPWYGTKIYTDTSHLSRVEFDYLDKKYITRGTVNIDSIESSYDPTGSVIDIHPKVYYDNTLLKENTDYVLITTPSPVQEPGGYTMKFQGIGDYAGFEQRSFVVKDTITGEGTQDNPYLITNSATWGCFAMNVNEGVDYTGKYFKLSDNFDNSNSPVTISAGTDQHPFKGIFDGNNRTLHIALSGGNKYLAPFSFIENATIKNLTVAGTITSVLEGDGTHGGFAGVNNGNSSISNCSFIGSMLGELTTSCGGFVGWTNGNLTYTDCVFNPAQLTVSSNNSATFNRNGKNKLTRCYYTQALGEEQGVRVTDDVNTVHSTEQIQISGINYYRQCDISGLKKGYPYTGSPIAVTPVVTFGSQTLTENTDYTVTYTKAGETITASDIVDSGLYTITVTGQGNYAGTYSTDFYILTGENLAGYIFQKGQDEEGEFYIIGTPTDWSALANYVASFSAATSGKRFKMTNDIAITTEMMIGTGESNSFRGIFDGDGHTLTIDLCQDWKYLAPFRYLTDATIRNLTVDGAIRSKVHGDASSAGFAGINNGETTFENCVFKGSLLAYDQWCWPDRSAGFVGWNSGTLHYIDCLFAPAQITFEEDYYGCATFNRNGNCDFVRTYYLTSFGEKQGTQAYVSPVDNVVCRSVTAADGNTYYAAICYSISSRTEWNQLSDMIRDGDSRIENLPVVLLADITVDSLTLGTQYHPFQGKFYGAGHTITLNLEGDQQCLAPFRIVENAEFHNLTVAGKITSTVSGDGLHGGFVGISDGKTSFERCSFTGSLLGSSTSGCGGFVGWNRGVLTFTNCLFEPASITMSSTNSATFTRKDGAVFEDAYYTTSFGEVQGKQVYASAEAVPEGAFVYQDTLFNGKVYYIDWGLKVDTEEPAGSDGRYYINMPEDGTDYYTIPAGVKSFKVYDNGGKTGYASNYSKGNVVLTAPKGCKLEVYGSMTTYGNFDQLEVHDGARYNSQTIGWWYGNPGVPETIDPTVTSQKTMRIEFFTNCWSGDCPGQLELTVRVVDMTLYERLPNDSIIAAKVGNTVNAVLQNRNFYTENWNTLCLPFDFSAEQLAASQLAGAIIKELDTEAAGYDHITGYEDGKLYLNFKDADHIRAGVPYFIKWADDYPYRYIYCPVFHNVTVSATAPAEVTSADGYVSFVGTFRPVDIFSQNKTNLYLGENNWLYYPWDNDEEMTRFIINSCRGWFRLNNGLTAGRPHLPNQAPLLIMLNIDGEDVTTDLGESSKGLKSSGDSTCSKFLQNGKMYILLPNGQVFDSTGKRVE